MPLSYEDVKRLNGLWRWIAASTSSRRSLAIEPFSDADEQSRYARHPLLMCHLPAFHAVEA